MSEGQLFELRRYFVARFNDLIRVTLTCSLMVLAVVTSPTRSSANEIKIQNMVPLEADTKVQVELTVRNCVDRIFDATIKSEYVPANFSGNAIVLGSQRCPNADWEIENVSVFEQERELFFKGALTVVPAWSMRSEDSIQYISSCQLSMCRIFQFESDANGSLVGAKMYHVDEASYLQAKKLTNITESIENLRSDNKFSKPVEADQKKLFAAVGNVIIFDDGSCALLGGETRKITEVRTIASCDNSDVLGAN